MALHLTRRKGSEFWYIRGVFHGHKVDASTRVRDHGAAKALLRRMEVELASTEPRPQHRTATFAEAAGLYLSHHPRSISDIRAIDRLVKFLGDKALGEIKSYMISEAAIALYPNASAATRNRMTIANASAILHYAADQDLCAYIKVKRFKEAEVAPRDVDATVARTLIASTEGYQRLLLVMLFRQGWRIGELLEAQWPHIDLGERSIEHHNRKIGVYDEVPLHDDAVALLAEIPEGDRNGNLFPWPDRWAVYEWLWPLTKRLGVRFTPHMARHTFATQLAAGGASSFDLLATGNWTDLKSVKRYTRLDRERARTVINRLK